MNLLVTGGAGFIGSNFIRYYLNSHSADVIVNLDKPTYAGNLESLKDLEGNHHYIYVQGDITNRQDVNRAFEYGIDVVVHFAAESHVDRSILDSEVFVRTNVLGTNILLDVAREHDVQKFVHVSTDEVYGSLGGSGLFTEQSQLRPNSPYSASKAGSDLMVRAYGHTYGLPVVITRCSNNYGPYQFPEKLIPLTIIRALEGQSIPIYGDGKQVRDWIHVLDHCNAIDRVVHQGKPLEVYNVGSNHERTNIYVVTSILQELGLSERLIAFVDERPGHDRRYAIDSTKIQNELGWAPQITFEVGLASTVKWYINNPSWWKRVLTGEYRSYISSQYGSRGLAQ